MYTSVAWPLARAGATRGDEGGGAAESEEEEEAEGDVGFGVGFGEGLPAGGAGEQPQAWASLSDEEDG